MPRLRILLPDGHSREHVLGPGRTTIGRSAECTVCVDHPTLSRQHAAVEEVADVWVVVDLGSKNGLRVDNRQVLRAPLKAGARFRCGKAEFEFLEGEGAPAGEPAGSASAPVPGPQPPPPPPRPSGAPNAEAQTPAAAEAGDETREIPEIARPRRIAPYVVGAISGLAAAGGIFAFLVLDGASKPRTPAKAERTAEKKDVAAPPGAQKLTESPAPPPSEPPPEEAPPRSLPDPEEPGPGEVRVRFRDGTALIGKVLKRTKFEIEIERVASGKTLRETYGIDEVLRVGDETVRPDWEAIFERKLAAAKTETELLALLAWCRANGYPAGQAALLEKLKKDTVGDAPPPGEKPKTVRWRGKETDPQELRADGRMDARGRLVLPADELRYVREVHFDLLGRGPTDAEVQAAAAESPAQMLDRLLTSVECFETWYEEELYYFLLLDNFHPATERMLSIPKKLSAGTMTIPDALHEIVICQYFNHRNPGNDTYVTVILEQLLGIVVQDQPMLLSAGKKMYDGYEGKLFGQTGKSQADLVSIVMKQESFYEVVLKRLYKRVCGIEIGARALENNVPRVMADHKAFHDIMREWLMDDAYLSRVPKLRRKTDHQFIRTLYVDLLGRRPTYDEFRLFRNALQALADPTPIRSVLAKVMVDSEQTKVGKIEEPKAWVKDVFVRMLGRAPTETELETFSDAVKKGKPKLAIQAIVDSTEYQHY
jgi:hypothetical protein